MNNSDIFKKIKNLKIINDLNITDNEINKMFSSFNTYINLNELCKNSIDDICSIDHFTYIRNPKTNNLIEVKCYCNKQKKINTLDKRIIFSENKQKLIDYIRQNNIVKTLKYKVISSNGIKLNDNLKFRGFYVYGSAYIGKTRFLYYLAKQLYILRSGTICFIEANELFLKLSNITEFKNEIKNILEVDFLFIDNFGIHKWPKNYFFEEDFIEFLKERIQKKKNTYIAAAMPIKELELTFFKKKIEKYKRNFIIEAIKVLTNNIELELIKFEDK